MPKRQRRVKRAGETHVWVVRLKGTPHLVLRWHDPDTGRQHQRSSRCRRRRDAEREAAKLAEEIEFGMIDREFGWPSFRERYEREKLSGRSGGTRQNWRVIADRYQEIAGPRSIHQAANPRRISYYLGKLREAGLSEETIAGHVRYLHAAFQWAADMQLIRRLPKIRRVGDRCGERHARGRPISVGEFCLMLRSTAKVRPDDWRVWMRLLRGLWLSGLRIEESVVLSWDAGGFLVDLAGPYPVFRIRGDAQKSGRDEVLPMTPDFARWLLRTPADQRRGPVFTLPGKGGARMSLSNVKKVIAAIGSRARVLVNAQTGKHATAHDLRRSFGTRWAKRVVPFVLRRLMRHRSIATTERYYVDLSAAELAAELWQLPHCGDCGGRHTVGVVLESDGGSVASAVARPVRVAATPLDRPSPVATGACGTDTIPGVSDDGPQLAPVSV